MRGAVGATARRAAVWLLALALAAGCEGASPPLPDVGVATEASPELAWWQRTALDRALDFRVWRGSRSGYVAVVAKGGVPVYARTTGWADVEAGLPMRLDTRFHLASMTKPVTAVAAMLLVEDDRLSLDDRVDQYLPGFGGLEVATERSADGFRTAPASTPLRVRHLLTFTSGIGGYEAAGDALDRTWRARNIEAAGGGTLTQRIERMRGLPLHEEPGTRWRYGWSLDVLARIVEVVSGEPYARFVERRVFAPLGMTRTAYPSDLPAEPEIARLYTHAADGSLMRDTEFADYGEGWAAGGGGLVSTAPDFLRFALMLAGGGALGEVRLLREETVAEMTRAHVQDGVLSDGEVGGLEGLGFGLGMSVVVDAERVVMPAQDGDFWWAGLFGTLFWVSPAADTVVVVMQATARNEYSGLPVTPTLVQGIALY